MTQELSRANTRFIDMEKDFTRFVTTFRGGTVVRDLIPDAPIMEPNADYYFSSDDVVAELKCLHADVDDREKLNERFLSVCQRLGYSVEAALKIAFRELPLPRDVAQGVSGMSLKHVRDALRKANRQILSTKRQLGRADALGLVIISNENNIKLTPVELIRFMTPELRAIRGSHIDGLIYMTPNLYHSIGEDGVARSLWLPGYRRPSSRLTNFVDELGAAWHKWREEMDSNLVQTVKTHEPPLNDFNVRPSGRTWQR